MFAGSFGKVKIAAKANLVDHQLRLPERQEGETFFPPIVDDRKTDQVTVEISAFPPITDGELGNQRIEAM